MSRLGKTPSFRGPDGEVRPGSIAEVGYRRLGGVDQWVMTRGESAENPPLILLHGGPGMSETGFFRRFCAPLERSFTVVYWDQRGAGKSFSPGIPRASMTSEQLLADLDELVDQVRRRLGCERVAIFGHSWGSALGALYSARHPEKVAAYVGSGQIGDWAAAESSSYAFALAEAERVSSRRCLKKLCAIGPPPYGAAAVFTERSCLSRLEGRMGASGLLSTTRSLLGGKEYSVLDLPGMFRGFRFSMDAMWPEVSRIDLIDRAPVLKMPVFFLLGRQDHWVPVQTSLAYFESMTAPRKELVWFEHSGHEPFVDEPAKFNSAVVELVRPLFPAGSSYDGGMLEALPLPARRP